MNPDQANFAALVTAAVLGLCVLAFVWIVEEYRSETDRKEVMHGLRQEEEALEDPGAGGSPLEPPP